MIPSFLLALREGVEAALVIGIVFSALRKLQRDELSTTVWYGVISAVIVSVLVAVGLNMAGAELKGMIEVVFEGAMLLFAAGLLTWMILWMHSQARFLKSKIETDVRQALTRPDTQVGKRAVFGVAFLAVAREGIELAIFLVAAGLASNPVQEITGALFGLAAAAGLGWLLFSSTRRLPLGTFFRLTNILLILFAAGLVAHGVREFNEIGWIPPLIEHIYDLNPIIPQGSTTGQILSALFGYNANPSLTELSAYSLYFLVLLLSVFGFQRRALPGTAQS
jgi:high-affinity iron transporter